MSPMNGETKHTPPGDRTVRLAAVFFFFFSGAASLVYEVAWLRILGTYFGSTTYSVTAVLTAFMGGLALGSFLAGRKADRLTRPLRVYALLEIGVGLAAVAAVGLMFAGRPVMKLIYGSLHESPGIFFAVKFIVAVVALGLPTTLMGATLPVFSRFYVREMGTLSGEVGRLYGMNTLGAFAGAGLAGFVLLGSLGLKVTIALAVVANASVGLAALALERKTTSPPPFPVVKKPESKNSETGKNSALLACILVAFGFSGFSAMSYQVAWTRVFELFIGSSTYAFTIILLAYLAGIAGGSLLLGRFFDRFKPGVFAFAVVEVIIAAASLAVIPLVGRAVPILFVKTLAANRGEFGTVIFLEFLIIFAVLLAPTFLMGALFPLVTRLITRRVSGVGRAVGRAYASNTLGTILGSAATGLVLIPMLGTQRTLFLAVGLNLVAAGILATWLRDRRPVKAFVGYALAGATAALILVPAFNRPWDGYVQQMAPYIYAGKYTKNLGLDVREHLDVLRAELRKPEPDPAVIETRIDILATLVDPDHPWHGRRTEIRNALSELWKAAAVREGYDPALAMKKLNAVEELYEEPGVDMLECTLRINREMSRIVFRREGPYLLAVVQKDPWGRLTLRINGKVDASTSGDMPTQVFFGHLGSVYRPEAGRALLVGLGSGITLGSLALHDIESIDAVEISPSVVEAAKLFKDYNHNVLENPRVKMHAEDARSFVALSEEKYDMVNSIPTNPWMAGVCQLFTREFFQDCRARLTDGGIMVQWVQRYCLSEHDFRMVMKTFSEVFDHVHVWASSVRDDFALVGSVKPLSPEYENIERLFANPETAADLERVELRTPAQAASLFVMGDGKMRELTAGSPVNTDDLNLLEFNAPKNIFRISDTAFAEFASHRENPALFIKASKAEKEQMTRAYEAKTMTIRAITEFLDAALVGDEKKKKAAYMKIKDALEFYPDEEMALRIIHKNDFSGGLSYKENALALVQALFSEGLVAGDDLEKALEYVAEFRDELEKARDYFSRIPAWSAQNTRASEELKRTALYLKLADALEMRARADVRIKKAFRHYQDRDLRAARPPLDEAAGFLNREKKILDEILDSGLELEEVLVEKANLEQLKVFVTDLSDRLNE